MISIIDCGLERLRDLVSAFSFLGCQVSFARLPSELERASHLVLAGSASFSSTMRELETRSLAPTIHQAIADGKPFLGIGIGMSALFETSEEDSELEGLGVIKGSVHPLRTTELPVPHTGWCKLEFSKRPPLVAQLAEEPLMFFDHATKVVPDDASWTVATIDYAEAIPALLWRGNLFATQFLPELSKQTGYSLLKAFGQLAPIE